MKKTTLLLVVVGLFAGFLGTPAILSASCPDYGIICNDNTCHGWYGNCWSWKHMMCTPCSDPGDICGDAGPKCVTFKDSALNIVIAIWCKYCHIPIATCGLCTQFPCSFSEK